MSVRAQLDRSTVHTSGTRASLRQSAALGWTSAFAFPPLESCRSAIGQTRSSARDRTPL